MSTTDVNNQTTSMSYDALGRLLSQTLPGETAGLTTVGFAYTDWCSGTVAQSPCLEVDHVQRLNSTTSLTSRGVLHHLDLNEALRQIHRVLAPGGRAIFMEALANNPLIHAYRKRTPHLRTAWEMEHILQAESVETMRELFRTVDVRYFHLAVLAAVPLRETVLFRPVLAVLDAVDRVVLRIPGMQRLAWMGCFVLSDPK